MVLRSNQKRRYLDLIEEYSVPLWPSGCWIWLKSGNQKGYGRIRFLGRMCSVHRVVWELHNGHIPDGLCVLHRCDIPGCNNIHHLFLGTDKDNTADMFRKGRQRSTLGESNGNNKLTDQDVLEIRRLYGLRSHSQSKLGEMFGVSQTRISAVVNRSSWKHV